MNLFCLCLFFLPVLLAGMYHAKLYAGWILVFWIVPVSLFLKYFIGSDRLVRACLLILMAAAVFFQDLKTLYFSKRWLALLGGMILIVLPFETLPFLQRLAALFPGALMSFFWLRKSCGSADVIVLTALGFVLGFERFLVCLLVSCLMALGYAWLSRQRQIPFLSFLAMGFLWSWSCGYRLFDFLCPLFWFR